MIVTAGPVGQPIGDVGVLAAALPYVEEAAASMVQATTNRAFKEIQDNTFTADKAFALWMEVWAAQIMVTRFKRRARMAGASANEFYNKDAN